MFLLPIFQLAVSANAVAQTPREANALPPRTPAQQQIITELLRQPLGPATLDALNMPEPYLRRAADRIIQSSFEQQYRIVVRDQDATSAEAAIASPDDSPSVRQPEELKSARRPNYTWLPIGIGMAVIFAVGILLALRKGGDSP